MLQEICKKSIPILPDALARSEGLFIRNEGVPTYVPQVLSKYGFSGGKIAARNWEQEVNMRRGETLLTSLRAGVRLHPSRRLGLASAPVSRA